MGGICANESLVSSCILILYVGRQAAHFHLFSADRIMIADGYAGFAKGIFEEAAKLE